ncbi:MAG: trypsin-like peptidase domain-containing protein [Planctomycetota bacterium]|nr:trypsin-like peptidase domain-containing protein [Planctomycetota bacterium]MEE3297012.1 trypsin-like peptidase domain-containing protein [Planctomycetota bacterium]
MRTPPALLAVCMLCLSIGAGSLAAQETKAEEPTRLEKLLSGEPPETIQDLKAMQERFRSLATKLVPCTVGLRVGGAQGSGVIISEDGYVLTAGHVSGQAGRTVTVILHNGKQLKGKTLGGDFELDAGLIKIEDKGEWSYAEMGKSKDLGRGQWCVSIGHPGGYRPERSAPVRVGRILDNRASGIRTDCMLVGGDSGGPLFDTQGKIIGINSRIGASARSNLHAPIDAFTKGWDRMVKGETWGGNQQSSGPTRGGPWLGVTSDPNADNAKIGRVSENSPAAKAGIKAGDIITRFDGKDINSFQDLSRLVKQKKPGDEIEVAVLRADQTLKLKLKLEKYEGNN